MKSPKHILILCSRLDLPAGIERAIVNAANLFIQKGNKVSLLILDGTDQIFFPLDRSVKVHTYDLNFGITTRGNTFSRKILFFNHLRILKRSVNRISPDVILATEYHFAIAARMVVKNKAVRVFSWEHHHFHHLKRNKFWEMLFKRYYPRINAVICLNDEEAQLFGQMRCKTIVIPNHIPSFPAERALLNQKQILTIGHLNKTKGIDLLPEIADRVFKKYPGWTWKIIGNGEETTSLENASAPFRVKRPDTPDIEHEYRSSSIYVLPSRFECFPMVLLEAMSIGVPVVAFNCPTGPKHIIKHAEDGFLIEEKNTTAMADAIIGLIENEERRKLMGSHAFENVRRFSAENIYRIWEMLLTGEGDQNTDSRVGD